MTHQRDHSRCGDTSVYLATDSLPLLTGGRETLNWDHDRLLLLLLYRRRQVEGHGR